MPIETTRISSASFFLAACGSFENSFQPYSGNHKVVLVDFEPVVAFGKSRLEVARANAVGQREAFFCRRKALAQVVEH